MTVQLPGRDGGGAAVLTTPDDPSAQPTGVRKARSSTRSWTIVIAGVLLLPLSVVSILTLPAIARTRAEIAAAARVVDTATLEAETGIRVNLVAVTADGGLIDMRFTVVDQVKAGHLFHDAASMPALFVERSGAVLSASHPLAHKVTVLNGATYFLFFANSGGAIQSGTPVSIVIDGLRTAPIDAQS